MSSNIAEIKDLTSQNELALVKGANQKKGVLCTLEGPFGSSIEPTRNKRKYVDELWDNILNSDEVKEMFDTKTFFGEADHPLAYQDRLETTATQISHCITSVKKLPNGIIYGTLDVLDTPNGRIIKTLVDYGSKLGISTRGAGQVIDHPEHGKIVDPATYTFVTWDIVVMPGAKVARLSTKAEDMNESKKFNSTGTLKDELINQVNEAIKKKDIQALKSMKALLENVNDSELSVLKESANSVIVEVEDTISTEASTELLGAYSKISELNNKLVESNELLNSTNKLHETKYSKLRKSYDTLVATNSKLEDTISKSKSKLQEYVNLVDESYEKLNEANSMISSMKSNHQEEIKYYQSSLEDNANELELVKSELDDSKVLVENLQVDLRKSKSEFNKMKKSLERLSQNSNKILNEYITLKCNSLGVNPNLVDLSSVDINSDIESINESLRTSLVSQSRLKLQESVRDMVLDNNSDYRIKANRKTNDREYSEIVDIVSKVKGM